MTNRFGMVLLLMTGAFIGGPTTASLAHEGQNHACHDLDNKPVGYDNISACCYNPAQDGPSNKNGYPFCPAVLDQVPGGEQYSTIDRSTLAHTHICMPGVDCGPAAQLSNVKPFYGTAGAPPPPPPPAFIAPPPPPPPVIAVAPPPPVIVAPAPIAVAPVAIASAGLGSAGLLAAGLGAAALIGVVALAVSDDDDSSNSTTGTR